MGGDSAIRKLIFITMHWDQIKLTFGIAQEEKLSLSLEPLLEADACMDQFNMKTETAWRIIHPLL